MPLPRWHLDDQGGPDELLLIGPDHPLRPQALAQALSGRPQLTDDARRQIEALTLTAQAQGLRLDLLVAALRGRSPVAAALAIESPGRSVLVQAAHPENDSRNDGLLVPVLETLKQAVFDRGGLLLQAILHPEDVVLPDKYRSAGFRYLTDLLYLDAAVQGDCATVRAETLDIELQCYSNATHEVFLAALENSYVDSADCPGLSGLRPTAEVMEGHRATGKFDHNGWYVALQSRSPVGVLLTAEVARRRALEVVYIGVAPSARGQGVGKYLMRTAFDRARALSLTAVTLGVDATNEPARRLYQALGFVVTHRRRVWIASAPTRLRAD